MLRRLLLALLLAAFAFPALANGPCHDAPMAAMHAMPQSMEHGMPRHDDHAAVPHVCIGCIPPASLTTSAGSKPLATRAMPHGIVAAAFEPASGTPPALPPPRRTA